MTDDKRVYLTDAEAKELHYLISHTLKNRALITPIRRRVLSNLVYKVEKRLSKNDD